MAHFLASAIRKALIASLTRPQPGAAQGPAGGAAAAAKERMSATPPPGTPDADTGAAPTLAAQHGSSDPAAASDAAPAETQNRISGVTPKVRFWQQAPRAAVSNVRDMSLLIANAHTFMLSALPVCFPV